MFEPNNLGKFLVNAPSCTSSLPGVTASNGFRNNNFFLDASFDGSWIAEGCQVDVPFTCKYSYKNGAQTHTQQSFNINVLRLTMPCTNAGCSCPTSGSAGSNGQRFFITGQAVGNPNTMSDS
jgi:hypothetical protein